MFNVSPSLCTEPNFTLSLGATQKPSRMSEPLELACSVTNIVSLPADARLGVNWEHTVLPGTSYSFYLLYF